MQSGSSRMLYYAQAIHIPYLALGIRRLLHKIAAQEFIYVN